MEKPDANALLEDYIWGRVDEDAYLRQVISDDKSTAECAHLLASVEVTQQKLNLQLRTKVEENHPRLLEQITAIEMLERLQSHFDQEVQTIFKRANQLSDMVGGYSEAMTGDTRAMERLAIMNRLLVDGLRCEELGAKWKAERDIARKAGFLHEISIRLKEQPNLRQWKWARETWLGNIAEMESTTRVQLVERLKAGLKAVNANQVQSVLVAMNKVLDANSYQRELDALIDESTRELDSLFLRLSLELSSQQISSDKGGRLLAEVGTRLHSHLEQFELLGISYLQHYARAVGKVIMNRVLANATTNSELSFRLLQCIYRSLASHGNTPACSAIKETLNPLKTSMLAQSLAKLFALVDEEFGQDEKKTSLIVERINVAAKAELQSACWDVDLQREMEGNVQKMLKYIAVKLEQQLQLNEQTLCLGARVSRQQECNYQLLNTASELSANWRALSLALQSLVETSEQAIFESMRSTVLLVLGSMQLENVSAAPTGPAPTAPPGISAYMGELCDHLKIFRLHLSKLHMVNPEALAEFIDYVITQFLLHISLGRGMPGESRSARLGRHVKDFSYLCRQGLQPYDSRAAKWLNNYERIANFIAKLQAEARDQEFVEAAKSMLIPKWFTIHMLINLNNDIPLPHTSIGWSIADYVKWFNSKTDGDRHKLLQNLMNSYRQAVIAKGSTEYVPDYPLIMQLISGKND